MKKFISLLFFIYFISAPVLAVDDIGNIIDKKEYPDSNMVQPAEQNRDAFMIQGSVEKNLDVRLEDCMKFALGNNPRIQAAMQDVFASDYRIKQAWSNWFPSISWQTGYTRIRQLQFADAFGANSVYDYYVLGTISVSEMLYDFGVTQNTVTVKKLENQQYKITLTEVINDVLKDVKNAYYNVLLANAQVGVAEDTVDRYERFYNQAKAFFEAGTVPKVDVTIAEVNLSNAKLKLIEAENAVDISMAKLNNAMGLPYMYKYNMLEQLKYNPCDITLEDAIRIAQESRPDFKLADVKVQTANQNVKLKKKAWYPKLEFQADYTKGGKSFTSNYGYDIGGYLNFPVINGMLIRNQIKEEQTKYRKEIANAQLTHNNIYLEIQNAYYNMLEKKQKIPVSGLQVKQAKENYDLSFGRYQVGVGNPVELKEAEVQYANAKLNYNNTLYEYNTARANLEKSIGKNIVANAVELSKPKNIVEPKEQEKQSKVESKENKPVVKTKHYKNKFVKCLHNVFSYPDD